MSRFVKWAFLSAVATVSFCALPSTAQAQGISIGLSGNNGSFFYSNTPAYYPRPYPVYYAPQVVVPVAPRPVYAYPSYYGPGYRPYYHHHHHGHHGRHW